jgi:hypothetical protein
LPQSSPWQGAAGRGRRRQFWAGARPIRQRRANECGLRAGFRQERTNCGQIGLSESGSGRSVLHVLGMGWQVAERGVGESQEFGSGELPILPSEKVRGSAGSEKRPNEGQKITRKVSRIIRKVMRITHILRFITLFRICRNRLGCAGNRQNTARCR